MAKRLLITIPIAVAIGAGSAYYWAHRSPALVPLSVCEQNGYDYKEGTLCAYASRVHPSRYDGKGYTIYMVDMDRLDEGWAYINKEEDILKKSDAEAAHNPIHPEETTPTKVDP